MNGNTTIHTKASAGGEESTHVCTTIAYPRRLQKLVMHYSDWRNCQRRATQGERKIDCTTDTVKYVLLFYFLTARLLLTIGVACSPSNFCNFCNCWTRDPLLSSRLTIFFLYSLFSETRISTFLSNESIYSFFLRRLSCAEICTTKTQTIDYRSVTQV